MDAAVAAIFLVPGLAVGSFLNVVAARVPLKRSIVRPGSACMSCGAQIAWYDNIPVLSYVLLRGRTRLFAVRHFPAGSDGRSPGCAGNPNGPRDAAGAVYLLLLSPRGELPQRSVLSPVTA